MSSAADAAHLTAFFDRIHPESGWRCLFTLPDRRHLWFQTSADLSSAALALDAQGKAVFHSCATFSSKQRKQAHVAQIRILWLDVDAGPDKPYRDARDAYSALEEWRAAAALPPPLVVASGGGLHVYWPLRDPLGPGEWLAAAHRLRALAEQHGLAIDSPSTIDSARVLRPPGTHNRKVLDAAGKKEADVGGAARTVRAGPLPSPYTREQLAPLFGSAHETVSAAGASPSTMGTVPEHLRGLASDAGLLNIRGPEAPSDPELVAAECAQVRRLQETRGALPEPDWYAVLGVLAHCGAQGRQLAHAWSSGDGRYTHDATEKKLDQYLAAADGPTTCARFEALNPLGCALCPHKGRVTSPIQLGRALPAAQTAPAPTTAALPFLPDPFFWHGSRLAMKRAPTDGDASTYHVVADYPVYISELQEAERSGGVSAVFQSWEPMEGTWRDFSLDMKEVWSDRGSAALAHHGVVIEKKRWDAMRSLIGRLANHYRGTQHYGTRYEQFGWKETAEGHGFVVGSELIDAGGAARVFGSAEVMRRGEHLEVRGELASWSAAANNALRRPGAEPQAFVAICGFASILYSFAEPFGGAIVHATTLDSGRGKTFALEIAASIWGDIAGLRLKERDTTVAKFIAIGTLGHLPVIYDELRTRGPDAAEILKEFVLHYTLGEDKARGANSGGLRSDNLPWSNLLLSAANLSLVDTCMSDGSETAQAARIFEFVPSLPEGVKTSEGDALKAQLFANAGTAGRAFVRAVIARYDWVRHAVDSSRRAWETRLQAGADQRYAVRLLAVVTVAAILLNEAKILDLNLSAILRWAEQVARENHARIATAVAPEPSEILARMMSDFLPGTLVMAGAPPKGPNERVEALREPRGELVARQEIATREYVVRVDAVRKWMQEHHYPMTEIGRKLHAAKIVTDLRRRRTLGAGWRRLAGQPWCWVVDGAHPEIAEVLSDTPAPVDNVVQLRGRP